MVERLSVDDIERRSGIHRKPDETINEYFQRDEFREFADEAEITVVRDIIQRRQFAEEVTINQEDKAAVEAFYTKLSDYTPKVDKTETTSRYNSGISREQSETVSETSDNDSMEADSTTDIELDSPSDSTSNKNIGATNSTDSDTDESPSRTGTYHRHGLLPRVGEYYGDLRNKALRNPRGTRALFLTLIILFSVPVGMANATYSPAGTDSPTGNPATVDTSDTNITFVAAQGTETGFGPGIFAYNDAGELIWQHNRYFRKYFDVDPIGNDKILIIAQKHRWSNESGGYPWVAAVYNWRNDTLVREFPVPPVTHDVDYMGGDTFIAANLQSHLRAEHHDDFVRVARERGWISETRQNFSHNIYQLNLSTGEIEWEYKFKEHFPRSAGSGYSKGYTHLNDVDVVDNGTAILASPRNFDRVVLIDKSTKELRWTLGEEDNYEILNEQHNPALLSVDPPVVLVADSENRRVVEYQRLSNGTWVETWKFEPLDLADNSDFGTKDLAWPRDADRFPNGNTLITASAGGHVLEVTPDKEVVWSVSDIEKVYEAERLQYGDEPRGPPITELRDVNLSVQRENAPVEESDGVLSMFNNYYYLASWVIPAWITQSAFYSLHLVLVIGLLWGRFEWLIWRRTNFSL